MSVKSTVAIGIEQLLSLRLLPAPRAHRRSASNSRWLGAFAGAKRGQGTDYDDLRIYNPGDDVRHIDWRVSARSQELHTRLYREEKELRSSIICDLRPCMFTGMQQLRASHAVMLAARVLWLACLAGTRINLVLLTSTGVRLMQPGSGHSAAIRGCALLADEHAQAITQLSKASSLTDSDTDQKQQPASAGSATTSKPAASLEKHAREHALSIDKTAHGPTLETLLQWMVTQHELKTTMLWFTALDYPGEQFFSSIHAMVSPARTLIIHIDEPVLHKGLPSGDYYYASQSNNSTTNRHMRKRAQIDKFTQRNLQQSLAQRRRERQDIMSALQIPCISTLNGDDEVIASLRHQAWIP